MRGVELPYVRFERVQVALDKVRQERLSILSPRVCRPHETLVKSVCSSIGAVPH